MSRLILFALLSFFSIYSNAQTVNYTMHQGYVTPRALGMGNTFMGIDDYNAIFYNPAAIAELKEGELNFAFQGDTSPQMIKFGTDLINAYTSANGNGAQQATNLSNVLLQNYGQVFDFRFPSLQAFWARPGWGIAFVPLDL